MNQTLLGMNYRLGKTSRSKIGKSNTPRLLPKQLEEDQCTGRNDRDQQPTETQALEPKIPRRKDVNHSHIEIQT